MKGWAWVLLGVLLGVIIGWLLRSIAAKRQVARARNHHVDSAELERLRGRVANLEPAVAERDRLQAELDECRAAGAGQPVSGAPGTADVVAPVAAAPRPLVDGVAPVEIRSAPMAPDLSHAHEVLGSAITLDDLKAIEGIGPKIESLCHGIGIRTWFDLSTTEVSLLRTMLADAGSRFATHDPSTWPQQAALLAAGRWEEFKALTDGLHGGRASG
jgi:predicted flap endonuclease-1-like 5' DNA nuclease